MLARRLLLRTLNRRRCYATGRTAQLLDAFWAAKDVGAIHDASHRLIAWSRTGAEPVPQTKELADKLYGKMVVLAQSGQEDDMARIGEMMEHIYPLLSLAPRKNVFTLLIETLATNGHYEQALRLFRNMHIHAGPHAQSLRQFHALLRYGPPAAPFPFLQQAFDILPELQLTPDSQSFALLLRAYFSSSPKPEEPADVQQLSSLISWCLQRGMTSDPVISTVLHEHYADRDRLDLADQIVASYASASLSNHHLGLADPIASTPPDFQARLGTSTSMAECLAICRLLDITPTSDHYALVIQNCITANKYDQAFEAYQRFKNAAITPTSSIMLPLHRTLLDDQYIHGDLAIDTALELYQHWSEAWPTSQFPVTSPDYGGPLLPYYSTLLRLVLASENASKYLPIAESLVEDIESRAFETGDSIVAPTRIILEMRRKGSFTKALPVFHANRRKLTEEGYLLLLRDYCQIAFSGDLEVPLITEYFSIVNNMRLRGVRITPKIYTVFLYHLGMAATRTRASKQQSLQVRLAINKRLIDTTRRVQQYLSLDAAISPDAILWNQLMNTYQRLGLFQDALKLWKTAFLSGRFDQSTVNIIIDACGWSGNLRQGRIILSQLKKKGYSIDLHNWNTWVEALCRNLHFDEAFTVITVDMVKNGVRLHHNTIDIFRKFAKQQKQWHLYAPRLESALPDLWSRLPDPIRQL